MGRERVGYQLPAKYVAGAIGSGKWPINRMFAISTLISLRQMATQGPNSLICADKGYDHGLCPLKCRQSLSPTLFIIYLHKPKSQSINHIIRFDIARHTQWIHEWTWCLLIVRALGANIVNVLLFSLAFRSSKRKIILDFSHMWFRCLNHRAHRRPSKTKMKKK